MLNLQPRLLAASSAPAPSSSLSSSAGSASGAGGSGGSGAAEKSREELVLDTLASLKNQMPLEIDLKAVKKNQDQKGDKTPLTIVLYQVSECCCLLRAAYRGGAMDVISQ
jgi:hypothetical protein